MVFTGKMLIWQSLTALSTPRDFFQCSFQSVSCLGEAAFAAFRLLLVGLLLSTVCESFINVFGISDGEGAQIKWGKAVIGAFRDFCALQCWWVFFGCFVGFKIHIYSAENIRLHLT